MVNKLVELSLYFKYEQDVTKIVTSKHLLTHILYIELKYDIKLGRNNTDGIKCWREGDSYQNFLKICQKGAMKEKNYLLFIHLDMSAGGINCILCSVFIYRLVKMLFIVMTYIITFLHVKVRKF